MWAGLAGGKHQWIIPDILALYYNMIDIPIDNHSDNIITNMIQETPAIIAK